MSRIYMPTDPYETEDHFTADTAERMGLVGRVVEDGQALPAAYEIAWKICSNGPLAVDAILKRR